MLGSMLIALDGSPYAGPIIELGIYWARQSAAVLAGLAVLDEPSICHSELVPLGGGAFKEHRDQQRLESARQKISDFTTEFEEVCRQAQVPCKTMLITGDPAECISQAGREFDLIAMGTKTYFHFATSENPCDTLSRVLHHTPRPVVAVPEQFGRPNEIVMVAYDGSLQAARALQAFLAVGLPKLHDVHIVTVRAEHSSAASHAQVAARFLGYHRLEAQMHPVVSTDAPAQVLLREAERLDAGLLVMGAYGQSALHEFFFGSTTKTLLDNAKVPIFLYH